MRVLIAVMILLAAGEKPAGYVNDFEKAELGKAPEEFLVLGGIFGVKQEERNRYLELAAEPLETFGFIVGSEGAREVRARIRGEKTGKRFPEFGVGLAGPAGFKLWVMPAVKELQIVKGEEVRKAIPYEWNSGKWTMLRLRIRQEGATWKIEGKAWGQGREEPKEWMISIEEEKVGAGKASVWGIPYSGKVMGFDDVMIGG